jgi:hypothetical protein
MLKEKSAAYAALRHQNYLAPLTLPQKILFKMAWDRNPLLTQLADKAGVRDYITARIGSDYLVPALAIVERPEDVPWEALPSEFAIKVTHGSGGVIVVSDTGKPETRLPVASERVGWEKYLITPQNASSAHISPLLKHWLSMNYEWQPGRMPEWAYRRVPPKIIIEELIPGFSGRPPADIKVYTFNGRAQMFLVVSPQASGKKVTSRFDREWNVLPVRFYEAGVLQESASNPPPLPANLDAMIHVAEALGHGNDFVRVDLYDDAGQLRVGEITNYPFAGDGYYEPAEFETWLGEDWKPHYWRARFYRLFKKTTAAQKAL